MRLTNNEKGEGGKEIIIVIGTMVVLSVWMFSTINKGAQRHRNNTSIESVSKNLSAEEKEVLCESWGIFDITNQ